MNDKIKEEFSPLQHDITKPSKSHKNDTGLKQRAANL